MVGGVVVLLASAFSWDVLVSGLPQIKCACLLLNHWQIVLH
jgi:hypothetical protein